MDTGRDKQFERSHEFEKLKNINEVKATFIEFRKMVNEIHIYQVLANSANIVHIIFMHRSETDLNISGFILDFDVIYTDITNILKANFHYMISLTTLGIYINHIKLNAFLTVRMSNLKHIILKNIDGQFTDNMTLCDGLKFIENLTILKASLKIMIEIPYMKTKIINLNILDCSGFHYNFGKLVNLIRYQNCINSKLYKANGGMLEINWYKESAGKHTIKVNYEGLVTCSNVDGTNCCICNTYSGAIDQSIPGENEEDSVPEEDTCTIPSFIKL